MNFLRAFPRQVLFRTITSISFYIISSLKIERAEYQHYLSPNNNDFRYGPFITGKPEEKINWADTSTGATLVSSFSIYRNGSRVSVFKCIYEKLGVMKYVYFL